MNNRGNTSCSTSCLFVSAVKTYSFRAVNAGGVYMKKLRNVVSEWFSAALMSLSIWLAFIFVLSGLQSVAALLQGRQVLLVIVLGGMWVIAYLCAINLLDFISNIPADFLQGPLSLLIGAVNTWAVCFLFINESAANTHANEIRLIAALLAVLAARYTIRPDADLRYRRLWKNFLASVIDGVGIAALIIIICRADFTIGLCVELFLASTITALTVRILRKVTAIQILDS